MIDVSSTKIEKFVVHHVGNKLREEGYILSSKEADGQEMLNELLLKHYLLPLSQQTDLFEFFHESDLSLNELYRYSTNIFEDKNSFLEQSYSIAKHLYSVSNHPNISGGELIIILFSDIRINSFTVEGLAVLKMESRDNYLDIIGERGTIQLITKSGISLNKIQKGCLILSNGNNVITIDTLSQKTKYWNDSFLKIKPQQTIDACARVGGAILKSVASKISDSLTRISLNKKLEQEIESNASLSLGELINISKEFVDERTVAGIVDGVRGNIGFDLPNELKLDSKALLPYAKKISQKTEITNGVSLIISDSKISIDDFTIEKTSDGFRAVIDMSIKEVK